MARFANSLVLALSVLATGSLVQGQAVPGQCGHDRWPVKTLTDEDRARVDSHPTDSSVAKLAAIPIHEIPYPQNRRIEPEELRVYRVRARLLEVRRERDSDLHLVIADLDDPNARMIAEVPAPECTTGTGHEDEYRRARSVILSLHRDAVIELVGVGFFDFLHDQQGGAKNGIELHPVFRISEVEGVKPNTPQPEKKKPG